ALTWRRKDDQSMHFWEIFQPLHHNPILLIFFAVLGLPVNVPSQFLGCFVREKISVAGLDGLAANNNHILH
ncbi:14621_t:CDS:2, partial [Dentiscutata heterogama]